MTREEKLDWLYRLKSEIFVYMPKEWLIPMTDALGDVIKALEQEPTKNDSPKYCDRNICLKNEYNNIGCEDCEVTKSQEPTTKNGCAEQNGCTFCSLENGDDCCRKLYEESMQESTTENDSGFDWESYKDVDGNCLDDLILEVLQNNFDCGNTYGYKVADEIIGLLPSVTPQEPKTGHLITKPHVYGVTYCSECDFELRIDNTNYCPNCGAKMAESEADNGND